MSSPLSCTNRNPLFPFRRYTRGSCRLHLPMRADVAKSMAFLPYFSCPRFGTTSFHILIFSLLIAFDDAKVALIFTQI